VEGVAGALGVSVACNIPTSTLGRINSKHHAGARRLPALPFLVTAISCFFRQVALDFRFRSKGGGNRLLPFHVAPVDAY